MAAGSLHASELYTRIVREIGVILDLQTVDGDSLYVHEGSLHIIKGGFLQGPTRTCYDIIKSGYNYSDVAGCLEGLRDANIDFLRQLPGSHAELADLKLFQRKVRLVAVRIYELLSTLLHVVPNDVEIRIRQLINDFHDISDNIKAYIREHKPEGWEAPPETIDFDKPVHYRKYLHKIPKGASIADILRLAQTAEAQMTGETYNKTVIGLTLTGFAIGSLATIPLSVLKFAVIDPVKRKLKGYDESRTPYRWLVDNLVQVTYRSIVDPSLLLHGYAKVLLNVPLVTDEHVEAFCLLAKHINTTDHDLFPIECYDLVSNDVSELLEIAQGVCRFILQHEGFNSDFSALGPAAREVLSIRIQNRLITSGQISQYLLNDYPKLRWIDDPNWTPERIIGGYDLWKQGYTGGDNIEERKTYYLRTSGEFESPAPSATRISLSNLLRVVDAIGPNPRCKAFQTDRFRMIARLDERLSHYSFFYDHSSHCYKRNHMTIFGLISGKL